MAYKKKSLNYYFITYAGVPPTEAGIDRFVRAALFYGKYTADEIRNYLEAK